MRALKMIAAHNPAMGLYADCVRTAIACLLDCNSTDEVPHFFEDYANDGGDSSKGWDRAETWLRNEKGLALFYLGFSGMIPIEQVLRGMAEANPDTYYLLCGRSSAGGGHCVIGLNDAIEHDPSWHNLGVVGPAAEGHYMIAVLIPAILKVSQ